MARFRRRVAPVTCSRKGSPAQSKSGRPSESTSYDRHRMVEAFKVERHGVFLRQAFSGVSGFLAESIRHGVPKSAI